MSGPSTAGAQPVTSKAQLVDYVAQGSKPKSAWRIGTEHEKFAFETRTLKRLPYDGPAGIRAMLEALTRFGWEPVSEKGNVIALVQDGASVTLEPGGQVELSGAPLENLFQTCNEVNTHLDQVKAIGAELGIGFMGLGFDPKWPRAEVPWMPKGRYRIMREYMPKKGKLGLDMMLRTCTVQVNLDYSSEADMVKKFRASLALQPIAVALFANSPFTEGKPNGFQSFRSHVWTDTDPDRSGMLDFVFDEGMSFERYVDYVLGVPMYFVYRDGNYIDASGQSFRDFMTGKLPAYPNQIPTMSDWADQMTLPFPEVRLKRFLEMRGADGGPWRRLCALPALWTGLLYDQGALDASWDLVKGWTAEQRTQLRADVPRQGFDARVGTMTVRDIARETVRIARDGLKARNVRNSTGENESVFLNVLDEIVTSGKTPADELLAAYETTWNRSVDPAFTEYAY
ncbi:MAG: glutamate--cysteine ligase [Alphaproteobacteria bacterium]|nr:glutamate--cysteine ligase [Alphaproteobacteria bacterium]